MVVSLVSQAEKTDLCMVGDSGVCIGPVERKSFFVQMYVLYKVSGDS